MLVRVHPHPPVSLETWQELVSGFGGIRVQGESVSVLVDTARLTPEQVQYLQGLAHTLTFVNPSDVREESHE